MWTSVEDNSKSVRRQQQSVTMSITDRIEGRHIVPSACHRNGLVHLVHEAGRIRLGVFLFIFRGFFPAEHILSNHESAERGQSGYTFGLLAGACRADDDVPEGISYRVYTAYELQTVPVILREVCFRSEFVRRRIYGERKVVIGWV